MHGPATDLDWARQYELGAQTFKGSFLKCRQRLCDEAIGVVVKFHL